MTREHRGSVNPLVILVIVALAATGVAAVVLTGPASGASTTQRIDLFTVQRGDFDITIPLTGELVSQRQIEIRNELEVGAVITELVDEGVFVNAGDVLMRLNDETIREEIRIAMDEVNTAENALAAAEADLAIRRSETASQLSTADLNIRLAELSLRAWEEGTVPSTRQDLEITLTTAEKNYDRLVARYEAAKNLLEKEFISLDEFRQDEISMIRARADLEQAKLAITVYDEYQYFRDKADLESALTQAKNDRERLELRTNAELESATSEVASREFQLENARARLAKLERQLASCTVTAPTDGLVIYASSLQSGNNWRSDEDPPDIGTELSRNQLVMVLPDTTRMVAEVKVGEGLSGLIQQGQRAAVMTDAVPGRIFPGVVQSKGVLAQSAGWRGPNRRDYTVRILLDDIGNQPIKPALRCEAVIYVGHVSDSLYVPVQAIHQAGSTTYVFVERGAGFEAQPVIAGQASEMYIQILEGLEAGDRVLLRRAQSNEIIGTLPQARDDDDTPEEDESAPVIGDPMEAAGAEQLQNRPEGAPPTDGLGGNRRPETGDEQSPGPRDDSGNDPPSSPAGPPAPAISPASATEAE